MATSATDAIAHTDERPRKLTRRSASPRGNVFRMMASVSRAGMSSRRADAAPDQLPFSARNTRARRTIVITTRALLVQYSRGEFLAKTMPLTIAQLNMARCESKDLFVPGEIK